VFCVFLNLDSCGLQLELNRENAIYLMVLHYIFFVIGTKKVVERMCS
jgi:hypothetical protein